MIRNVQHCRIRNPTPDDFEGRRPKMNLSTHDEKLLGSHLGLTKETCDTMKSQTKIEHAFEMWEWLLEYAQSFESRHLFYEVSVPTYECNDPIETVYSDDFERDKIKNKWLEVMKDHPVEQAMKRANMASYEDDLASFKRQRSRVVHFLEDQYQREVKTWTKLCQFIQGYDLNAHTFFEEYPDDAYQRRTPGFKPDDHFWSLEERNDCAPEIAITYLRDCVDAFKRDMSSELKNTIRLHEYSLKKKNKSDDEQTTAKKRQSLECKRTRLMESLTRAYDDFDVAALRSNFKEVVDGLEEEFRRVRRARKALLTSDVLDKPEVDLGEDEDEVDDRIDWDATGWNTESKTVLAWAYWDFPDYYHTEDGWKKKEKVDQKVDEGVDIEPYWWNGL
ncbi:hypothetical protein M7I_7154 [Glarea lozoyensis 74030]|nr:hypothetical protein M7I_7154 [Glarea lozoyensis 74030]